MLPYAWMVILSLKPNDLQFATAGRILTGPYILNNFSAAWDYAPFGTFLINSVVVAATGGLLTVVVSLMAGYGFARLPSRMLNRLFRIFVATLFVPPIVFVVPLFVEMRTLGWANSYQSLIVPFGFSAVGVFLMRQAFAGIPRELEEAAGIDGASHWRAFWQIMVPQVRSFIAVLFIFSFLTYWNNFLWPLIVINSTDRSTVPLGLELFLGQHGGQWNLLMAATVFTIMPAILVIVIFQRAIVRGISTAGLGGR
jgi:multiple sugar transport system permease protein